MAASDGRPRIALVGFPPELRDFLTEWLSEEGYSVSSLDPGLPATSGGTPHLILAATDPRAESLATLDVLRIQPETAAIPVIVLSTSAAQQDQAQALGNVYATLSMPFEFPDLLDAVRGALAHTLVEARVHTLPSTREPGAVRAAGLLARAERELMLSGFNGSAWSSLSAHVTISASASSWTTCRGW